MTFFDQPVLVFQQKGKLLELTNEYDVVDGAGAAVGTVVEVDQSVSRKAFRAVARLDRFLDHAMEVRDLAGTPVLVVTQEAKVAYGSTTVSRPGLGVVGTIVRRRALRKARFDLTDAAGTPVGRLQAQDKGGWHFVVSDGSGAEVARISSSPGSIAKVLFTTSDTYVLELARPLADPLLSLVLAASVTIDSSMKQGRSPFGLS